MKNRFVMKTTTGLDLMEYELWYNKTHQQISYCYIDDEGVITIESTKFDFGYPKDITD